MDKYIMKKTSFFEICKLLDENEGDISKCINGLFEIALLFLPGLVCKDVAFIMNLANGVIKSMRIFQRNMNMLRLHRC